MSIDQAEFRQALGSFASGVTVVTTSHLGHPHGTTVSGFCSLSLNPPLVLVCIAHSSANHDLIQASSVFGVNILSEQSEWLSRHFARRDQAKFATVPHHPGQLGVPLLDAALATLECRVVAQYPGGDHSIFVGEVMATSIAPDGHPLLHFRGRYNRIESRPTAVGSDNNDVRPVLKEGEVARRP